MKSPTITPETLRAALTHRARPKPTAARVPWWMPLLIGGAIAIAIDLALHGAHPYITP